jgi:outer membrane receptor protein involved in Fe transport
MLGVPERYTQRAGLAGYVAGEIYTQDGPFEHPEDLWRYNIVSKLGHDWRRGQATLTATAYSATWDASGQIPLRVVQQGRVGRFGSLDPSEGGKTQRLQLYLETEIEPHSAWDVNALGYAVYYDFDLFSNFTFYLDDPVNGDQIQQKDNDRLLGGLSVGATHHAQHGSAGLDTRMGFQLRADTTTTELNHTRERFLLAHRTRNDIEQFDLGWYLGEDVAWTPWLRTITGVRLDHLRFTVGNLLDDSAPSETSSGAEGETVVSPKASAVVTVRPQWDVYLNLGRGFHSNDARGVTAEIDPADPVARATGAEIGTRWHVFDPFPWLERMDLAGDFFFLDLDSELVFVGDEGTTEPTGATRRYGFEFEGRWRFLEWVWADFDATVNRAFYRNAPADADNVPLAPRYTLKGGLAARHPGGLFGGLRARSISDRPANEEDSLTAQGYAVFDLEVGYARAVELPIGRERLDLTVTLDVLNLLDARYREAQFNTASCTRRERRLGVAGCAGANPPGISDIDFTPGWPRTVLAGIRVQF